MQDTIDKIWYLHDKVAPKYPQDKALFSHVNKKALIYRKLLEESPGNGPQSAKEVGERMEAYAKEMGTMPSMPPLEEEIRAADEEGAPEGALIEESMPSMPPLDEVPLEWGGLEPLDEEMPTPKEAAGNQPQNLLGMPIPAPQEKKRGLFSRVLGRGRKGS